MNTIKLQAPEGVTDVSYAGQNYKVGNDGTVEVPAEANLTLYQFGFTNCVEPAPEAKPAKAQK